MLWGLLLQHRIDDISLIPDWLLWEWHYFYRDSKFCKWELIDRSAEHVFIVVLEKIYTYNHCMCLHIVGICNKVLYFDKKTWIIVFIHLFFLRCWRITPISQHLSVILYFFVDHIVQSYLCCKKCLTWPYSCSWNPSSETHSIFIPDGV